MEPRSDHIVAIEQGTCMALSLLPCLYTSHTADVLLLALVTHCTRPDMQSLSLMQCNANTIQCNVDEMLWLADTLQGMTPVHACSQ